MADSSRERLFMQSGAYKRQRVTANPESVTIPNIGLTGIEKYQPDFLVNDDYRDLQSHSSGAIKQTTFGQTSENLDRPHILDNLKEMTFKRNQEMDDAFDRDLERSFDDMMYYKT